MRRLLPPAGLPLGAGVAAGAIAGCFRPEEALRALTEEIERLFPERKAVLTSSGRAALYRVFRLCREIRPEREEVVVGGYTCWSVAAAAIRAGLRLRLADVDPETLDFDREGLSSIRWERVAAVVTHHLFGIPNNRARILRLAEKSGAWLIDDAAQALGAEEGGVRTGAAGEAGVLSFGRGKSLPALSGGVLLLQRDGPLGGGNDPDTRKRRGFPSAFRAAGHRLLFGTLFYPLAAGLPVFHVGETIYRESFSTGGMDGYTAALAARLLSEAERRAEARRAAAAAYASLLAPAGRIRIPSAPAGATCAFIRFPVLVPPEKRAALLDALGPLGAAVYYPSGIHRIPNLPRGAIAGGTELPGTDRIASSLLTLPTHPLATPEVRERIAALLLEGCG
jgi:dTDP-4-amino-4,6-dideoxygalactose transaminase